MHRPGDKSSVLRECQSRSGVLNSRVTGLSWHPMLKYFLAFYPKQTIVLAAYLNSLMLFFERKDNQEGAKLGENINPVLFFCLQLARYSGNKTIF